MCAPVGRQVWNFELDDTTDGNGWIKVGGWEAHGPFMTDPVVLGCGSAAARRQAAGGRLLTQATF